jgi:hypothetical protein
MAQKRQTIHFELDALNHLDSDFRRALHSWSVAPELHGGWREGIAGWYSDEIVEL